MVWQGFKPFQFFKPCSYFVSYTYIDVDIKADTGANYQTMAPDTQALLWLQSDPRLIILWKSDPGLCDRNKLCSDSGGTLPPSPWEPFCSPRERERVRFYQAAIKLPRPSAAATKIGNLVELSLIIVYAKYKQVGIISFTSQFLKPGKTNDAILEGY